MMFMNNKEMIRGAVALAGLFFFSVLSVAGVL
jgi:hypothetical protein